MKGGDPDFPVIRFNELCPDVAYDISGEKFCDCYNCRGCLLCVRGRRQ
jgi:hypothetical protein